MEKRDLVCLVILIVLASLALGQECTTPTDGMAIAQDTLFCAGTYDLPSGISVAADIVLDGAGATVLDAGASFADVSDACVMSCVLCRQSFKQS